MINWALKKYKMIIKNYNIPIDISGIDTHFDRLARRY